MLRSSAASARATSEERVTRRLWHRLPWLLLGLAGAMFAAGSLGAFEQELERPVDGRRLRAHAGEPQRVEDLVGADRCMSAPDQLQHPPSDIRQLRAALLAKRGCPVQRIGDAMLMVVGFAAELAGARPRFAAGG